MKLPEDRREQLKEPKGNLFESSEEAFEYLDSIDYKKIITVGDIVSAKFLENGWDPDIIIVDFKVMRSPVKKETKEIIEKYSVPEVRVDNPAGHLSEDILEKIKTAETPVKIVVEGEEDLAAIPAVIHSPDGSVVAYGQPEEGVVLVEVSEEKKEDFMDLFNLFKE